MGQKEADKDNRFGNYITVLRKQRGITQERLCEGICSPSLMTKLEKSERQPGKLLQDRLLERLGTSPSDYENLLAKPEYERWLKRMQIQRAIKERKWDCAADRLEQYGREYDMNNSLERQYYLSMLVQLKYNTEGQEKLAGIYKEAIGLTMPGFEKKRLSELALSVHEMNLILEYARFGNQVKTVEIVREVLDYIENACLDEINKAKLYPKAVSILWEKWQKVRQNCAEGNRRNGSFTDECKAEIPIEECNELLKLCNRGIELLRDSKLLYYMWELLCMRQELLQITGDSQGHQEDQKETEEWKGAIEALYQECGIPVAMYEFCYLYEENEVYCIGDVIRIRRNMLGMDRKQLCKGVCDVKTLRRMEKDMTKPQITIAEELLKRLKLPAGYCRTELQTDNPEAKHLMRELRSYTNEYDTEGMEKTINRIETLICMEDPFNRQVMSRYRLIMKRMAGEVTDEEYIKRMTMVLEMTLPLEAALADGEKYMTNEEIMCIQNMVLEASTDTIQTEQCIHMLREFYQQYEEKNMIDAFINMYEPVMWAVASCQGNLNKFEDSSAISSRILRESLLCRRAVIIDDCLYNDLWNYQEQQKRDIPCGKKRNIKQDLQECLNWGMLTKKEYDITFYQKKMDDIMK